MEDTLKYNFGNVPTDHGPYGGGALGAAIYENIKDE